MEPVSFAIYLWPAYGITALLMGALWVHAAMTLRRRREEVAHLSQRAWPPA